MPPGPAPFSTGEVTSGPVPLTRIGCGMGAGGGHDHCPRAGRHRSRSDRGGWYTPRWVEALFFRDNAPSADHLIEEYDELVVGEFIPDGPPEAECGFFVREVEPQRYVVLESSTRLVSGGGRGPLRGGWPWARA